MSRELLFWIVMLLWLVFGVAVPGGGRNWSSVGAWALPWIAVAVLGWIVLGSAIK